MPAGLIFGLFGCSRAESPSTTPAQSPPAQISAGRRAAVETVASVHWLGKRRLDADTNATGFMAIWKLPESIRLESQTLDKASTAPWRLLHQPIDTNASALLRPLLDDVVQSESFLEVQRGTNGAGALVFAIKVEDSRAGLWQTNLARVFDSLTGIRPEPQSDGHGWTLRKHHLPNLIEVSRAGGWVLVGAAANANSLMEQCLSHVRESQSPFPIPPTNDWISIDADLRGVAEALSLHWQSPGEFPRLSLSMNGDGQNVRTHAEFDFPYQLAGAMERWNIPTNVINGRLVSFTAARGLRPWLASLNERSGLKIDSVPDQCCVWTLAGVPPRNYCVFPLVGAEPAVDKISKFVLQKSPSWFVTNGIAKFERARTFYGLEWRGLPYLSPFVQSVASEEGQYLFAGTFPLSGTNDPPPPEMLNDIFIRTNLVAYDWELTGPRVEQVNFESQFARLILDKAQLPPDSAGLEWLNKLASHLGNTVTRITKTGPQELTMGRYSSFGFTAIELQAMADWLESPDWPGSLHTFAAPPDSAATPAPAAGPPKSP